MTTSWREQLQFERQLYAAFPCDPAPAVVLSTRTQFEREAMDFLNGTRWPEAVGVRLVLGELDANLAGWISVFPTEVIRYYLPSHLMLASLELKYGEVSDHCWWVMQGLVLPPPDPAELEVVEEGLDVASDLASNGPHLVELYATMTPAQRACVATYLDLWLAQHPKHYFEHNLPLYAANRDYWAQSSYPLGD